MFTGHYPLLNRTNLYFSQLYFYRLNFDLPINNCIFKVVSLIISCNSGMRSERWNRMPILAFGIEN